MAALQDIFKVLPKTMLPMPRLFDLHEAVTTVNAEGIAGAFVECGVWNGGAVGLMGLADRRCPGPERVIHLFDSFEGLPQPTEKDTDVYQGYLDEGHPEESSDALRAIGACRGEGAVTVQTFLTNHVGIPRDQLAFHVGWFQDTVPTAATALGPIAILRLDGDWYESTKVCIENLYDLVVEGGFLVIDDYGTFTGCREAIDAFFKERGEAPDFIHSDDMCVYLRKPRVTYGKSIN
ncbi:hypothetical protein HCU64_14835 [Methylobacterium sp. C25]|nr:hypothetical protein [Methylobacterium sp. C25]